MQGVLARMPKGYILYETPSWTNLVNITNWYDHLLNFIQYSPGGDLFQNYLKLSLLKLKMYSQKQ
jgi:hypothetical protein